MIVPVNRPSAIAWARLIANHPGALFLDTETTGLDGRAEIIDIAIVDRTGRVVLNSLVQPEREIPPEATAIHGLTMADVRHAPRWSEIVSHLVRIVSGRLIVVYNADFDRRMIHQCCSRCGQPAPSVEWHCAMRAFAAFRERPSCCGGYRWYPLEAAAAHFGVPPGGHRALGDAETCRRVVLAMAGCDDDRWRGLASRSW
jgi:DNA polymerase-3 subunit epsilon